MAFCIQAAAPVVVRARLDRPAVRRAAVARAGKDNVESAIKNAKDECATGSTAECAAAWDVVEEVSAAQADAKTKAKDKQDPLEAYCETAPDADECRVYSD